MTDLLKSEGTLGLVSVVMPAYNSERFLAESVASVRAQTYKHWELLIVDDASCDGTPTLAQRLASEDARIRVLHLNENGGVANARNVAMKAACGHYLAFLDSDDLWLPHKLKVQIDFMRRKDATFSFARYRPFREDGYLDSLTHVPDKVEYGDLLNGNVIGCLTVMIDRGKIPPFTFLPVGHEDYAAWLQILKTGQTAWGIQEDLARYRLSTKSVSSDKKRCAVWTWKIYRQVEELPLPKATLCFINYSLKAARKHFLS